MDSEGAGEADEVGMDVRQACKIEIFSAEVEESRGETPILNIANSNSNHLREPFKERPHTLTGSNKEHLGGVLAKV